jgi:hypothetical protein
MPDLKLTRKDALKLVAAEAEKYTRYFRDEAERIAEMLAAAGEVATRKRPVDIASAEVAAVIELTQQSDLSGYRSQLRIDLSGPAGGCMGDTQLGRGLKPGRYRALVLIDRIDE